MIKLTVKKFNDFTQINPVIACIQVAETNQEIPTSNIFRHDSESNNFMKVDLSGDDDQYYYSSYEVKEGFSTPEKAEEFITKTLLEITEAISRHRGSHWEQEEEFTVEI